MLVAAASLLLPTPARAEEATLRVSPPRTQVGRAVLVRGRGFTANAPVALTMSAAGGPEGPELARTQVDDTGAFRVRVVIPDAPPGEYTFKAASPDRTSTFAVTVDLAAPPDPD